MKSSYLYLPLSACLLFACSKNNSSNETQKKKAEEFASFITSKSFQLVAFYSDKPIDFDQSDGIVKAETDLWAYVRPYVRDDVNTFETEPALVISQGTEKIAGLDSALIHRNYAITYDNSHVYLNFVDYNYEPLRYKLQQFDAAEITVYVDWPGGAKLFSRFDRKQ